MSFIDAEPSFKNAFEHHRLVDVAHPNLFAQEFVELFVNHWLDDSSLASSRLGSSSVSNKSCSMFSMMGIICWMVRCI